MVLFLSDGKPTFYYDKNGETAGSGDEDADEDWWGNKYNWGSCSSAAYAQADKMTGIHYFYAIGIGRDENRHQSGHFKRVKCTDWGEECGL